MIPSYRAAFTGDPRNVPLARNAIASFARLCGFAASDVEDIRLAAGEALNNAVEHGIAARSNGFSVRCTFDDGELQIEIRDNGAGFEFEQAADGAPADLAQRGYGIFLMRRLMDDVRYDQHGTRVRLLRRQVTGEI
ncbi:MAG: ATP-binding protein [bacterium]|nr:ATP-binding protein [bacterium]